MEDTKGSSDGYGEGAQRTRRSPAQWVQRNHIDELQRPIFGVSDEACCLASE